MKIIELKFENINSYEGEVTINFTDPGIQRGNNQFVVCGPMGSGKSTILDAITLALYGRTARLGRFTVSSGDSSAELINKHSGYCRAEVIYSCAKGVFASVFDLHKARDKADGKVQKPQCALFEMAGGERMRNLLDSTTTDALQKKTEEIIGLSYDQFIRCILIPQGEFDRFLNSNEREKAAILAKLSHTEHYKKAAEILNEKASSINQDYKDLENKRDAIHVMSEDERKECDERISDLHIQVAGLEKEIGEIQSRISWLDQLKKAEDEYAKAVKAKDNVRAEAETYRQNTEELDKARKADNCAIEYNSLQTCISNGENIKKQQTEAEKKLVDFASEKEEAEKEAKRCTDEYIKKKDEKEKQRDIWNQVRKLDTDISVAESDSEIKKGISEKANKDFEEKKGDYNKSRALIDECANTIKELSGYLEENKADKDLESILAVYGEKEKARKAANARLDQAQEELEKSKDKKVQCEKRISNLEKEKDELEEKLHALISSKYLLVAGILRKDLRSGSLCPVCGKKYESDEAENHEDHKHPQGDINDEEEKVAGDISELNNEIEKKQQDITAEKTKLQDVEHDIETATDNADSAKSAIEAVLDELSTMLEPWNKQLDAKTSEEEFDEIKTELTGRKNQYDKKKTESDDLNRECEKAKDKMNTIDLAQLQKERDTAEENYKDAKQKYNELEQKRQELFGTKSVDEAEKALDDEIRNKETEKAAADEKRQKAIDDYNRTATEIKGFKNRKDELEKERETLNSSFLEKLKINMFASEEEFRKCRRSEQEINELNDAVRDYEHKKTEAETTFANAKKTLDDLRANVLTTESSEALNTKKHELEEKKSGYDQEIGRLGGELETDNKNREKWEAVNVKLQDLGTEAETYSRISEMLGKKDGSDFEVFVQGIAMRSLLEKANVYLESIIPKYRLVQRADNSIDFLVNETRGDLTEIRRDIKNFSGGEKFIISLSLALAMAEFAGQNGDVECIFLDEGFGTLSGAPLLDAINALKRLSSTGKMLGIITHIEAVIQAFNKIEARKTGEKSILYGPGVSYSERNKNHR